MNDKISKIPTYRLRVSVPHGTRVKDPSLLIPYNILINRLLPDISHLVE